MNYKYISLTWKARWMRLLNLFTICKAVERCYPKQPVTRQANY